MIIEKTTKAVKNLSLYFLFHLIFIKAQDLPNIVWIVTEDNSKDYYHLYKPGSVLMPNVQQLAKHGLIFNYTFSQGPVCSVARSTVITGCYAPRIGAQYHRRTKLVPMPEDLKMFPYYLREQGYYTSNNYKEDYNLIKTKGMWDDSSQKASYINRKKNQPFFHVQNFTVTHEGKLHFSQEEMNRLKTKTPPETIELPPHHPDTKIFRYTYAKYHDQLKEADIQIGEFLDKLEYDGLMDNTFIFYFSDHGGVLPRSKGYVYESGLHVPLIIYIPPKWKNLIPGSIGDRIDGFIRFIDLAPTVLNLAGVDIPEAIDGKPFLGKDVLTKELSTRNTVFSYADRFDEKYDLVRAWRKDKYKYIRNYQPFNIDGLFNFYRYRMLAYQELKVMHKAGELNPSQQLFFKKRPVEGLYDLEKDPDEVNNLASDSNYQEILLELRGELKNHVKKMPDLSFYPENYFLEYGLDNPVQFGQNKKLEISRLVDIADLSLESFVRVEKKLRDALVSDYPWDRYWALIVCSSFEKEASSFFEIAERIVQKDPERLVALRAAEFLELNNYMDTRPVLMDLLKRALTPTEASIMLNTIAVLKDSKPNFEFKIPQGIFKQEWIKNKNSLLKVRVDYINELFNDYPLFN